MAYKLSMAREYGFQGVEVFFEDLLDLAKKLPGGATDENQLSAARTLRKLCDERELTIIALQPFMHYEGLIDRQEHQRRIIELQLWFKIAHTLGTDLILFPSSNLPADQITEDMNVIINDFVEAADLGLQQSPVIRFAFEALCWGTRIDTWEQSWEVVQQVDRPNFGLCLDSFNILGRIYADPTAENGCTSDCESVTLESTERLLQSVDVDRVFLVQVADAERLEAPLNKQHPFYNPEQPSRMSWSRNARLFYGESSHGAYLPSRDVLHAIITGLGFEGWLSFEVFNRRLAEIDASVPEEMARRAAESWAKMRVELGLRTVDSRPQYHESNQARL